MREEKGLSQRKVDEEQKMRNIVGTNDDITYSVKYASGIGTTSGSC